MLTIAIDGISEWNSVVKFSRRCIKFKLYNISIFECKSDTRFTRLRRHSQHLPLALLL